MLLVELLQAVGVVQQISQRPLGVVVGEALRACAAPQFAVNTEQRRGADLQMKVRSPPAYEFTQRFLDIEHPSVHRRGPVPT